MSLWPLARLALVFCLLFTSPVLAQSIFPNKNYDLIIVGSEPEGVIAAVAAAEMGASTLLITEDPKLGGLFVMGQMNSLDLKTQPFSYQQGLFLTWWRSVGMGHSFDVKRAEEGFNQLLISAGVDVQTNASKLSPFLKNGQVAGIEVTLAAEQAASIILASQVIDASSEMDFAAAAGAEFSFGFSSIGYPERMADTLVFRINDVNWPALEQGVRAKGKQYASVDEHVAWGHFAGYPAAYKAKQEGIRLRGLNLGRQEDGSVLVNALLIYGIDPFDPASILEGYERAEREAPLIIDYLKQELPGFEQASYGGVADKLYIRETRHLDALCELSIDDVMDNRVSELAVAAGGYPLDVQTLTPHDHGFVFGAPDMYGVELCVNVPNKLDNLWVVGKSAGYDPLAASSARVVPFGMALAEAVGVAAALSIQSQQSPATFATQPQAIMVLREILRSRGAYVPEAADRPPLGPRHHPYYADYRFILSRGLALGGYSNNPELDKPMTALGYVYLLSNVAQRFLHNPALGRELVAAYPDSNAMLTSDQALNITVAAACQLGPCPQSNWDALKASQLAPASFSPRDVLTRGEMYALASHLVKRVMTGENP